MTIEKVKMTEEERLYELMRKADDFRNKMHNEQVDAEHAHEQAILAYVAARHAWIKARGDKP